MGNKNSKENNLEDFIVKNENEKKVDMIYNITGQNMTNYTADLLPQNIKTEEKKLNKIKIPFFLDDKINYQKLENNNHKINFSIKSEIIHKAKIFFNPEWEEKDNIPIKIINSDFNHEIDNKIGENFNDVEINKSLNLKSLLISIHNLENNFISYNFYKIKNLKNDLEFILNNKIFFCNNKYIKLTSIYGLSESKLNNEKKDKETCSICLTNEIDTMIKPCNHLIWCQTCSVALKENSVKCPKCRGTIKSFVVLKNK